jgi:hypothetical protein
VLAFRTSGFEPLFALINDDTFAATSPQKRDVQVKTYCWNLVGGTRKEGNAETAIVRTLYKAAKMLREVESPSKVAAAKSRPHQAPKSKESDAERPVILTQTLAQGRNQQRNRLREVLQPLT